MEHVKTRLTSRKTLHIWNTIEGIFLGQEARLDLREEIFEGAFRRSSRKIGYLYDYQDSIDET